MKKFLMPLLALVVFACSKDQKTVNKLDGEWRVTGQKENGVQVSGSKAPDITYKFTKCKVSKGECDGMLSEGGKSMVFTYKITNKGERITINVNLIGQVTSIYGQITEHTKNKFVYYYITEDGTTYEETLERN